MKILKRNSSLTKLNIGSTIPIVHVDEKHVAKKVKKIKGKNGTGITLNVKYHFQEENIRVKPTWS